MTSPTPSPRVTGTPNPNGTGHLLTVSRSKIHTLSLTPYSTPPVEEGAGWVERYAVQAMVGASNAVTVADFATEAEAVTYVTDDPDGLII